MTPYLDFHTHTQGCQSQIGNDDVLVVQSLHLHEAPHPRANYVTYGIHPMLEGTHQVLQEYISHPSEALARHTEAIRNLSTPVIGIGECGWDRRAPLTLEEQEQLINLQLELSRTLGLPMIFHIVGAWHHLLALRKQIKDPTPPWVVHGFRGKPQLAQQLTHAGLLLSLHPKAPCIDGITTFLETDDTPYTIQEHYQTRFQGNEAKKDKIIKLFYNIISSHLNK